LVVLTELQSAVESPVDDVEVGDISARKQEAGNKGSKGTSTMQSLEA
jgi:hypothetical protein